MIVPFDRTKHGAYLFGSLADSMAEIEPFATMLKGETAVRVAFHRTLGAQMKRTLASPGTVAKVAVSAEEPDQILGVVVARPEANEIVWCSVKYPFRRMGLGVELATSAGIDTTKPIAVRHWTFAAERIAQRDGWRLFHKVTDEERAA